MKTTLESLSATTTSISSYSDDEDFKYRYSPQKPWSRHHIRTKVLLVTGKIWGRDSPVKLVYQYRRSDLDNQDNSPHRRAKSAHQSSDSVNEEDLYTTRISGASRILYASKPKTSKYVNVPVKNQAPPIGFNIDSRPEITATSSPESISTSITSLTDQEQFGERKKNGNRINLDGTRPSGIPYIDSVSESDFALKGNEDDGTRARNGNDVRLVGPSHEGQQFQSRIGYQEEQLVPQVRNFANPDMNTSFKAQYGTDPRVSAFTPAASLPDPRASKSSTTRAAIEPPAESTQQDYSQLSFNTKQISPVQEESEFSPHTYEVIQDSQTDLPDGVTDQLKFTGKQLSVVREEDELKPPSLPLTPPPQSLTVLEEAPNRVGFNISTTDPLMNKNEKNGNQFDLLNKVSVPVGSLIQQRLHELSLNMASDIQSAIPKSSSAKSGVNRKTSPEREEIKPLEMHEKAPTAGKTAPIENLADSSQKLNKQYEYMDTFIDQQFSGLAKNRSGHLRSTDDPQSINPQPTGWRDFGDPAYENISADPNDLKEESLVAKRVKEFGGKTAQPRVINSSQKGNSRFGLSHSVQPGGLIAQRVKELMASSVEPHSVTSNTAVVPLTGPESVEPELRIDAFRLVSVLGIGKFGKVFLAEHKQNNDYVAFKTSKKIELLRENNVDCLKIEKRVLQVVTEARNPLFVHMLACLQHPDYAIIVLEYIPGGDLMHHIQQGKFTEARAAFYSASVVLALDFLHARNIIYRDLKLENLLLTANGFLKLIDFGLCKEGIGPNDRTDTFCGTPEFMAPEMITDSGYTRAVDWWCLGVLIYEMLVGKCPFTGATDDDIYNSIVHQQPKIPFFVGTKAGDIISQFMKKNPVERLGATSGGVAEIKRHSFFTKIDFEALLRQQVQPPFIPTIESMEDVSNFDSRYTAEIPRLSPVETSISPQDDRQYFADFDVF
ncbi:hypothetical protein Aperf_G00000102603 [Anoplocephala perfoliata]